MLNAFFPQRWQVGDEASGLNFHRHAHLLDDEGHDVENIHFRVALLRCLQKLEQLREAWIEELNELFRAEVKVVENGFQSL